MENIPPIDNSPTVETGDWGLLTGDGEKPDDLNSQCPMPNAQCPMPKTELILYLIPVIGFFPSLWTLYRRQGNREQMAVSRLSITLALAWLLGYLLFTTGAETAEFLALRLLILNSLFTSGYFLVSVWLIFRLIQGKPKRLPGFSNLADKMFSKYLS